MVQLLVRKLAKMIKNKKGHKKEEVNWEVSRASEKEKKFLKMNLRTFFMEMMNQINNL
jgi:hypothetical protein